MIKITIYASFQGSAVGFHMGAMEYDEINKTFTSLDDSNINPVVEGMLIDGNIESMSSTGISGTTYVTVLKGIDTKSKFVNFAFETDRPSVYMKWRTLLEREGFRIASEVFNSVIPDNSVPRFGIRVDHAALSDLLDRVLRVSCVRDDIPIVDLHLETNLVERLTKSLKSAAADKGFKLITSSVLRRVWSNGLIKPEKRSKLKYV